MYAPPATATEIKDETKRAQFIDQILKYNEEDLDATWAVLQWLRSFSFSG